MINFPSVQHDIVRCEGGWDEITPPLMLKAGVLKDVQNFECSATGGYSRIEGYERLDGRASPSDASYGIVQVVSFTNTPSAGQVLTQAATGASGTIVYVGADFMVLTIIAVGFNQSTEVKVGATVIGNATTTTITVSSEENAQYLNLAADAYRALITAIPGSGSARGGFILGGSIYGFRNNAGGTAVDLYKATTSGWTQVAFEYEVSFSNANTSVGDGDTLTQGGVTATIRRVMVESGTLLSGTNTGRLIISVPAGGNFAAGLASATGGANNLTLSGAQTAITWPIGGKFETVNHDFFGNGRRTYGVDGVNLRAFEFDGTVFAPIYIPGITTAPKHCAVLKEHLFIESGSNYINSAIGEPYDWTTTHGAASNFAGATVSAFRVLPGSSDVGAMMIASDDGISILYGTSGSDWKLVSIPDAAGAKAYTIQNIGQTVFINYRGLTSLAASQAFGNFESSTYTQNISKWIAQQIGKCTASCVNHKKSQYRLFFNDATALFATFVNGKYIGATKIKLACTPYTVYEGETGDVERILIFATDGFVYEMDKGTSLDGAAVEEYLTLNWNNARSPRTEKTWKNLSIEMFGQAWAQFYIGVRLGYGNTDHSQPLEVSHELSMSEELRWDSGILWDTPGLTWDGVSTTPSEIDLEGTAENIQISIRGNKDYVGAYTINSMIFDYIPRRRVR